MAHTELPVVHIVGSGVVEDAGHAGVSGGHKFSNDGLNFLRVVNGASNANAVVTIAAGSGTAASGNYQLSFQIAGFTYTTANIAFGALKAAIATAVLAATRSVPGGTVALSADYSTGVVTGGGTDLPTGPVTLTFSSGLAHIAVTNVAVILQPSGGTYDASVTTPGTGTGFLTLTVTATANGYPAKNTTLTVPVGTYYFGPFPPGVYNQLTGTVDQGEVYVDYDIPANYTVTAYRIG